VIKISRKSQYGIRALLDLSLHVEEGPVFLKDIAQRENIPLRYLEQIFISLRIAGLIRNKRGPHGGYQLIRLPEKIKLSEIIKALEGNWDLVECEGDAICCSTLNTCVIYEIWEKATEALSSVFEKISLRDLVERNEMLEKRKAEISRMKQKWLQ
jgi:Rrf2 family protein